MPSIRDTSIMLKLIMVLLYMMTEWLLWMKPMPAGCQKLHQVLAWHSLAKKGVFKVHHGASATNMTRTGSQAVWMGDTRGANSPPISAARLKTWSHPLTTFLQFS